MIQARKSITSSLKTFIGRKPMIPLSIIALSSLLTNTVYAQTDSGQFQYEGQLLDSAGLPVTTPVLIKTKLMSPGTEGCTLYEGAITVTPNSSGYFDIQVGSPSMTRIDSAIYPFKKAFINKFSFSGLSCASGSVYTPQPSDGRKLQIAVSSDSGATWDDLGNLVITAAPVANTARYLNGFTEENFCRIDDGSGAPTPFTPFTTSQDSALRALINGTSSLYARSPANTGQLTEAEIPTLVSTGKVSGSAITSGTIGGSTAISTSGSVTANSVTTNSLAATSVSIKNGTNSVSLQSPAGSTYSLLFPTTVGTSGQVLTTDGTGTLSWQTSAGGGGTVTNISTGTGLTGGPITSSGTISLSSTGVSAGSYGSASTVPQFAVDSEGRITSATSVVPSFDWAANITNKPTTLSGYAITDAISNGGGTTPSITSGTEAGKPGAGVPGRLYVTTDSNKFYRDNGSVWSLIGGTGPSLSGITNIDNSAGNITLAPMNTSGSVLITSGASSVGSGSGALVVTGGVGISGSINSGGDISTSGTISTGSSVYTPLLTGGTTASQNLTLDSTTSVTKGKILMATGGGNVGIGTTNPTATLDVAGQIKISGGSPGTGKVLTSSDASGLATWQSLSLTGATTGTSTTLGVNNNGTGTGHVAIGYQAGYNYTGTQSTLLGYQAGGAGGAGSNNTIIGFSASSGSAISGSHNTAIGASSSVSSYSYTTLLGTNSSASGNGAVAIGNGAVAPANSVVIGSHNGSVFQERLRIDQLGKVGIGTTTPQDTLSLQSSDSNGTNLSISTPGNIGSQQAMLNLMTYNNGSGTYGTGASGKGWQLYANGNAHSGGANNFGITFFDGATWYNPLIIEPNGNIGMGTNNPTAKVDIVYNSPGAPVLQVKNNNPAIAALKVGNGNGIRNMGICAVNISTATSSSWSASQACQGVEDNSTVVVCSPPSSGYPGTVTARPSATPGYIELFPSTTISVSTTFSCMWMN